MTDPENPLERPAPRYSLEPGPAKDRLIRHAGVAFATAVSLVCMLVVFGGFIAWNHLFSGMPATPEADSLWALNREPSVEVLAADGTLIGHRGPSYGRRVEVDELPDHLVEAFLAAEDQRFYSHGGVDVQAIVRAAVANWREGGVAQGGSTITQQLVKNLVVGPEQTIRRKAQEARLAMALERRLPKDEILALYLNRVYLGERAYGVEAASQRYFGKSAREVTLSEAALLAALPKAPTRLSPEDNLEAARDRARTVLLRMQDARFITETEAVAAIEAPADLVATPDTPPAVHYGYVLDEAIKTARQLAPDSPDLVIRTTIDTRVQEAGYAALTRVMARDGPSVGAGEASLVSMAYDGEVLAMIGGRDYAQTQFNRVTQALRQPGSAFKPFVYAAAFEMGMRPTTIRTDGPVDIDGWKPENFGGGYRGRMTLHDAFIRSVNTVAASLGQDVGPRTVADMARRFGVKTELAGYPSIALGSDAVTLMELTAAYGVFAREGAYAAPYLVLEITDTAGKVLYERPEIERSQVYATDLAHLMTYMMRDVVRRGTGTRAAIPGRDAAGKTGTSQNYRDAWFVGFTGNLISGVWVGNDDDSPMRQVTGGRVPAMIWHDFMVEAEAEFPATPISAPELLDTRGERRAALYSELASAFERAALN